MATIKKLRYQDDAPFGGVVLIAEFLDSGHDGGSLK